MYHLAGKKTYVAGHNGMVGSALARLLNKEGCEVLTSDRTLVDLRNQAAVNTWFSHNKPEIVFLAAARVGGIHANQSYPAEFLYDNLTIASNIIHAAKEFSVQKLLFLGSSCIYPRLSPQPIQEKYLLSGPLEPTNEWYAIAKIAGLKMTEAYRKQYGCDFISCMPTNLYGPGDNYDLQNSHVLPALIRKIHEAKIHQQPSVTLWGTGQPKREFLYVDDLAEACVFMMKHYSAPDIINIGVGFDLSISELADTIAEVLGYTGQFIFDTTMPDGTPRKQLDISQLRRLGWQAKTSLKDGIFQSYQDFLRRHP